MFSFLLELEIWCNKQHISKQQGQAAIYSRDLQIIYDVLAWTPEQLPWGAAVCLQPTIQSRIISICQENISSSSLSTSSEARRKGNTTMTFCIITHAKDCAHWLTSTLYRAHTDWLLHCTDADCAALHIVLLLLRVCHRRGFLLLVEMLSLSLLFLDDKYYHYRCHGILKQAHTMHYPHIQEQEYFPRKFVPLF